LRELRKNLIKFNAQNSACRQSTAWNSIPDDEQFLLLWVKGGAAPAHSGFGTRLLEMVVAAELGGSIQLSYGETGFRCRIICSNASVLSPEG
jgi:two-component sensor histidine kinase